jgi:hypothetical protein
MQNKSSGYRILGWLLASFNTLKILFHFLLLYKASVKKHALIFILGHLDVMLIFFSGCF